MFAITAFSSKPASPTFCSRGPSRTFTLVPLVGQPAARSGCAPTGRLVVRAGTEDRPGLVKRLTFNVSGMVLTTLVSKQLFGPGVLQTLQAAKGNSAAAVIIVAWVYYVWRTLDTVNEWFEDKIVGSKS